MYKKYIVRLTAEERGICHETIRRGGSERVRRAQILLKTDADGPAWTDRKEAFSCRTKTVESIRRNLVEEGRALERKRTPPVPKILDGEAEARVIAMYEGQQGYANWSLRLLAGKIVEFADKPRNGEADAKKKTAFPAKGKSSTGYPEATRSSWREWNKCLKFMRNPTTRSVRWSAWTSSRCS